MSRKKNTTTRQMELAKRNTVQKLVDTIEAIELVTEINPALGIVFGCDPKTRGFRFHQWARRSNVMRFKHPSCSKVFWYNVEVICKARQSALADKSARLDLNVPEDNPEDERIAVKPPQDVFSFTINVSNDFSK